jgi:hypothetical protein
MVRDLDYFAAYLRSIRNDGRQKAEEEIRRLRLQLEIDKDAAVGKGKKLDEKKLRLKSLVDECQRLAFEIGLMEKHGSSYGFNTHDPDIAWLPEANVSDKRFQTSLLRRLFVTYSSFAELIFQIRAAPQGKIYASHDRTGDYFRTSIKRYRLDMTQWTFEASRDLATQLGLINWRRLNEEETSHDPLLGKSAYVLYLTSTIFRKSEVYQSPTEYAGELGQADGYLLIPFSDDALLLRENVVTEKGFEDDVWREYLRLTDRVPREPIYYCTLRDRVCEALRIRDDIFDQMIDRMIASPRDFSVRVSPGEGSLPLQTATSRKQIPPRLFANSYMTYLKMEKPKKV